MKKHWVFVVKMFLEYLAYIKISIRIAIYHAEYTYTSALDNQICQFASNSFNAQIFAEYEGNNCYLYLECNKVSENSLELA